MQWNNLKTNKQITNTCHNIDGSQVHYATLNKSNSKGYIMSDYMYKIFLRRQDYRDRKEINGYQRLRLEERLVAEIQGILEVNELSSTLY